METTSPHFRRILLVDDDEKVRAFLASLMQAEGFEPIQAPNGEVALALLRQGGVDAVLLDIDMPGMSGMNVLKEARKLDANLPILMVTGHGSITSAVEAVKHGAYDYVTKPFDNDELILSLRRALESRRLWQENQRLRWQIDGQLSLQELMGSSDQMRKVFADVERVAPTEFTVIIHGETGSGKELVARGIHRQSRRAGGPFVPVDCGAIQPTLIESELFGHEKGAFTSADKSRPGKFEAAKGGTVFLDEVQNLPLAVQTKFLRALQERQITRVGEVKPINVDVRVIAATNQNLGALVPQGKFRQDLYHRLNEFNIKIPSLRDRRDDIPYLAQRFLDLTRAELQKDIRGLTAEAADLLLAHSWPGNVRELRNVIRRAVLLADTYIEPMHLGLQPVPGHKEPHQPEVAPIDGQTPFKEMVRRNVVQVERAILEQVLKQTGGNKAKAARILQIDYKTMHTKAKEYGLIPAASEETPPPEPEQT